MNFLPLILHLPTYYLINHKSLRWIPTCLDVGYMVLLAKGISNILAVEDVRNASLQA